MLVICVFVTDKINLSFYRLEKSEQSECRQNSSKTDRNVYDTIRNEILYGFPMFVRISNIMDIQLVLLNELVNKL